MTLKLSACPFCGGSKIALQGVSDINGEGVLGCCMSCGAEGPAVYGGNLQRDVKPKHRREAAKAWNQRAPERAA